MNLDFLNKEFRKIEYTASWNLVLDILQTLIPESQEKASLKIVYIMIKLCLRMDTFHRARSWGALTIRCEIFSYNFLGINVRKPIGLWRNAANFVNFVSTFITHKTSNFQHWFNISNTCANSLKKKLKLWSNELVYIITRKRTRCPISEALILRSPLSGINFVPGLSSIW